MPFLCNPQVVDSNDKPFLVHSLGATSDHRWLRGNLHISYGWLPTRSESQLARFGVNWACHLPLLAARGIASCYSHRRRAPHQQRVLLLRN